jgi:RHS repeat-associated protein
MMIALTTHTNTGLRTAAEKERPRRPQSVACTSMRMLFLLGGTLGVATVASAEEVTYYYTNQQGTPLAMADAAGNVIAPADYRPYGTRAIGSPDAGPGYAGHVNDVESGLVYMQARYYDPSVGRFISVDPKPKGPGDIAGAGAYTYANNNPIGNFDADGRDCTTNGGITRCVTVFYDVSFAAQRGFEDFTSSSENYHLYSTPAVTDKLSLADVRAGLIAHPTPGPWANAATATGTANDATPWFGGVIPYSISPVVSFTLTNALDGQPAVVNVTQRGHGLAPGIVVREAVPAAQGGVLIQSWGEGTAVAQAPWSPIANWLDGVWKDAIPEPPPPPTGCDNNQCLL